MSKTERLSEKELTIVAGLLDFYSDRATAHASFSVAGWFGIYTVLFNYDKVNPLVFFIVYVALLLLDGYLLADFMLYARLAHYVRGKLMGPYRKEYDEYLALQLESSKRLYLFRKWKHYRYEELKNLILGFLWLVSVLLPFGWIVIFGKLTG